VVLLTIFPCLNYANLAVARALARAKEVGVRKVSGARDSDLKRLFLTESVLTSLFALSLAWVLHLVLNGFIKQNILSEINNQGTEPISFEADATTWLVFILFGITVGLFAGWLPARRLSKMRAMMTVGQFAVSLIFMIVVATLWNQMQFMTLANYGFQKENLLTLDLKGNTASTLAAEIAQDHRVKGVCASSILIAGNSLQGTDIQREPGGEKTQLFFIHTDQNYVPVMGLRLVAGENFPEDANPKNEQYILLNEKAVTQYQFGTPAEAIGKTLWLTDSTPVTVRGVLADFNFRPLNETIKPFALRFSPKDCGVLQIRLTPGDPAPALASIESIWKKTDAVHPFEAAFMEEKIRRAYSAIKILGGLIGFFALLGLSLASLGMLGMVTYMVGAKVKEIGVRKVVGASVGQVVLLISRRFLVLLGVAVGLAVPLGWFLSNFMLDFFAYRIPVGFSILASSASILLFFGLMAIGVQTVRAALANPIKSLRSE
jgi:putative ABC transport system permease protein